LGNELRGLADGGVDLLQGRQETGEESGPVVVAAIQRVSSDSILDLGFPTADLAQFRAVRSQSVIPASKRIDPFAEECCFAETCRGGDEGQTVSQALAFVQPLDEAWSRRRVGARRWDIESGCQHLAGCLGSGSLSELLFIPGHD
jgi:hypothetical protein